MNPNIRNGAASGDASAAFSGTRERTPGPTGRPPLKPQYQALFEASLADQATGGQGNDPTFTCIPPGMPRAMTVVFPMEILIMPDTTYMIIEYDNQVRRIYTDGRAWPK